MDTIVLFPKNATTFTSNGLGSLTDAITCVVTEKLNGLFELEMTYPITGRHYNDIQVRNILFCRPNPNDGRQAFRIYAISKPLKGIVKINAAHISYDLSGYVSRPFEGANISEAIAAYANSIIPSGCPFTLTTDKSTIKEFKIESPRSARNVLGDEEYSFITEFPGDLLFNNYSISLLEHRGSNRGVTIRYGKNLTELTSDEDASETYSGVYPYFFRQSDDITTFVEISDIASEKIIPLQDTLDSNKIYRLDLTEYFEDTPSSADLRTLAETFISNSDLVNSTKSLTVSYIQLSQAAEYNGKPILDLVFLGDDVNVEYLKLGVSEYKRVITMKYDVISGKIKQIELGDPSNTLVSLLANNIKSIDAINTEVKSKPNMDAVNAAIDNATSLITGNSGGYVVLHSTTATKKPDEILIMNADTITSATKVWRFNLGGLGYSSTGYSGTYGTAITMDGAIVADFITTGRLKVTQNMYLVNENSSIILNETGITIKYGNDIKFQAKTDGTLIANDGIFSGQVTATSGAIGGWSIASNRLTSSKTIDGVTYSCKISANSDDAYYFRAGDSSTAKFSVSKEGLLTAVNATISGNITATTGNIGDWKIEGGELVGYVYNPLDPSVVLATLTLSADDDLTGDWISADYNSTNLFKLTRQGVLIARGAKIQNGSSLGDDANSTAWNIGNDSLYFGSGSSQLLLSTGSAASYTVCGVTSTGWMIVAGTNFGVLANGTMVAQNAAVSGAIVATTGAVGGWSIADNRLEGSYQDTGTTYICQFSANSSDTYFIRSGVSGQNPVFKIGKDGSILASAGSIGGWYIAQHTLYSEYTDSGTSVKYTFKLSSNSGESNNFVYASHGNTTTFAVTKTGLLYAIDAIIAGDITATTGAIGGWTIASNRLRATYQDTSTTYSCCLSANTSDTNFIYAGVDGSTPKFSVTKAGALTATSGSIAGWTMTEKYLRQRREDSGTVYEIYLSSDPNTTAWIYTRVSNVQTDEQPFKVSKDGTVLMTAGKIGDFEIDKDSNGYYYLETNNTSDWKTRLRDTGFRTTYNPTGKNYVLEAVVGASQNRFKYFISDSSYLGGTQITIAEITINNETASLVVDVHNKTVSVI